jgi:nitroreductase
METLNKPLTVTAAAEQRNSIRKYTDAPITDADINEILRVAGLAPSPWNVQPWRVIVVREPETKARLMEAAYGQPQVGASAATFVLYNDMIDAVDNAIEFVHPGYGDKREEEAKKMQDQFRGWGEEGMQKWGHAISYTYLGFLLLAIQSQGFSSSAMLGFDPEKVKALLELPAHATLPALIAVGKPAEEGFPHHRHEVRRIAKIIG